MPVVHILNQYLWPDGAPTGVYAEQLAVALQNAGHTVRLVGGSGCYRKSERTEPPVPRIIVPHFQGKRGRHLSAFREYYSVHHAFAEYIGTRVKKNDIVIVTSAPPTTLSLAKVIRQVGAISIYWLQDYYPELIRGVWDYPAFLRAPIRTWWSRQLAKWDRVIKAAGNIYGDGNNIQVIRNWPTIHFPQNRLEPKSKTALYAGNFGYGHHLPSFVAKCRELLDAGYEIKLHADGPGVAQLPEWLPNRGSFKNEAELQRTLQECDTHLVAGHPEIQHAVFPSKIWNSIALERKIVPTGFAGAMTQELEIITSQPPENSLSCWCDLVSKISPLPELAGVPL